MVLKLQACKYLTDLSLEPLYKNGALPSLCELDLSYGTLPSAARCLHLSSLNLSLSANLKEVDLACLNLCFLNLSNCCSLEILKLDCPKLTSLFLQVVMDNGLAQITLSTPGGMIDGIGYKGINNLLEPEYGPSYRGYWDLVWSTDEVPKIAQDRLSTTNFSVIAEDENKVELSFTRTWNPSSQNIPPMNIDKRYVMLRGSPGFYTYSIYERLEGMPGTTIAQTRVSFKLSEKLFNYMTISDERQRYMPTHKDRKAPRSVELAYHACITNSAACITGGKAVPIHGVGAGLNAFEGVVFEIIITFALVYTVYATAADPKKGSLGTIAPIAIGFIVGANILAAGPFSGGSMNPAHSFGPAVASGDFSGHWIYWVGPLIGGALAGLIYGDVFIGSYGALPASDDYA
ncbi:hypothetical protein POM88_028200 [Heracleum sosnowskyi]|uniref:Uncharacterized protein n=1 Tax=Heracleum sosnowskyi TaxID=360622 RepID=A0AAD8I9F9_9APIA|nr:hypothetical protein POM88_037934 [Heracleum sosnowskyi]KAK1381456.1 hypothetical protein POM88_028200 [Heracleum sosnowskyi]